MKKTFLVLTLVGTVITGPAIYAVAQHEGHVAQKTEIEKKDKKPVSGKQVYYCPMHPSYTSSKPGDCPICNMKLIKQEEPVKENVSEPGFYVSPEKQQLIGVKIEKAAYRPMVKNILTVGRVAFDPDLYKSQQEYIEAIKTLEKVSGSGQQEVVARARALVDASRLKLGLSGLSEEQIDELAQKGENDESLLISSIKEGQIGWVYATIYEYELDSVRAGQDALITSTAYPDKEFKGKIIAIDPVFDVSTRSVRARIATENSEGLLKPNMYVDVRLSRELGELLVVPKEAIMDSGLRKIVFVSLPDGYLQNREVKTGAVSDDYVQIIDGVKEGEDVVVSGNFLIDSESKLKSALDDTAHQHGQ